MTNYGDLIDLLHRWRADSEIVTINDVRAAIVTALADAVAEERERFSRLAMDLNDWAIDSETINPAWSAGIFEAVDRIRDVLEEDCP